MMLKTYSGRTMADALAEVKKDLGREAVILHTRTYKVGGVLGVGGRSMVEITASSGVNVMSPAERRRRALGTDAPEPSRAADRPELPGDHRLGIARKPRPAPDSTDTARPDRPKPSAEVEVSRNSAPAAATYAHPRSVPAGRPTGAPAPSKPEREAVTHPPERTRPEPPSPAPVPRRAEHAVGVSGLITPAPFAPQTDEAGSALRHELDAIKRMVGQVLQSTRQTAAQVGRTGTPAGAACLGGMPDRLFELYVRLLDEDVPAEIADELAAAVRDELTAGELTEASIVRETLLRHVERSIRTVAPTRPTREGRDRPLTIALVGPTGVGKTTTIAKLAAAYKLRHGLSVGLVTSDTYRIAAVDQLRTYAGIIGLPLKVAMTVQEMRQACESLSECDVVLLDTAGRSQNDGRRLDELRAFIEAAGPDETHLVLSSTVSQGVISRTAERFGPLGPDRCILTKMDEAVTHGAVLGVARAVDLPLSFLTTGQEVPDHIETARADRLARMVVGGGSAS